MDDLHYQRPLNVAHKYARSAETYELISNFEEASKCHQKAIEHLLEAKQLTSFPKVLESLELQCDFHQRQQNILRLKILRFQLHHKLVEKKIQQMVSEQYQLCNVNNPDRNLECAIFRNIQTVDSLLDVLIEDESQELTMSASFAVRSNHFSHQNGIKLPKSDTTVIEELRTLNAQLRNFVVQLLTQLDDKQKQVESLHLQVKYLESSYRHNDNVETKVASLSSSNESIGIIE